MITTIRIDDELKNQCEEIFEDLGLTMTSAITVFLRQVVKQRGIPFMISCDRVPLREPAAGEKPSSEASSAM